MIYAHTMLNTYDICPRQMHERYVVKRIPREPQTKEQKWGVDVHKAFENRINKGTPWPEGMDFERFIPVGNYMMKAELALGIRQNGKPCGFWDSDCWLRGKIDIRVLAVGGLGTALILDVKTGKRREDPEELATHACLLAAHEPEADRIYGHYIWLKDGVIGKQHQLSDTDAKLAAIREKTDEIEHQLKIGYMPPKQGPLCNYCPVKSCEFNGSYRKI